MQSRGLKWNLNLYGQKSQGRQCLFMSNLSSLLPVSAWSAHVINLYHPVK